MNKNKIKAIIFDMDGTLYQFDDKDESQFSSSQFGQQIHENCIKFFETTLNISREIAIAKYQDFRTRYNDEVSLGVEKELGIDRSQYFAATWDLNPSDFVEQNHLLLQTLSALSVKTGVLSAAPRVWVDKVLRFLNIKSIFDPNIFTGDRDLRKPDPKVFEQFIDLWGLPPHSILSIGDQETTDILPAKKIGMRTARIGRNVDTLADFQAPNVMAILALLKQKGIL